MINELDIPSLREQFLTASPFQHVVIDNFFLPSVADQIAREFPSHDSDQWTVSYNNPIEVKKACSHWDRFPKSIYQAMFYLCSQGFLNQLEEITNHKNIFADYGLHGGGMHSHGVSGKLNMHKDYYIHPKLPLKRNFNIIIYMTPNWQSDWGGNLQLWSHNNENNRPKQCVQNYDIKFNRAVLFNTVQNSWHGLPDPIKCPPELARRSLACYYLTEITLNDSVEYRYRAQFVPHVDQQNDPNIEDFCEKRSKF